MASLATHAHRGAGSRRSRNCDKDRRRQDASDEDAAAHGGPGLHHRAGAGPGFSEPAAAPGGDLPSRRSPDILARLFADKAQLGQPVVVDNKPGAGGNIGAEIVAKSPPDGHTLVMATVGTHSINGALYSKMPYDMVRDFSPVAHVASAPNLLVVNNDLPVKNVAELITYMKANPDKLSFGSPGIGTSVHVSGELFKSMTGTKMQHVPYKGRQFAIPDLVGGSIQVMFDNMPSALPMAKEGKIRALAQTTSTRSAAAPDVPTVAETVPGFEATTWFALFAPAARRATW